MIFGGGGGAKKYGRTDSNDSIHNHHNNHSTMMSGETVECGGGGGGGGGKNGVETTITNGDVSWRTIIEQPRGKQTNDQTKEQTKEQSSSASSSPTTNPRKENNFMKDEEADLMRDEKIDAKKISPYLDQVIVIGRTRPSRPSRCATALLTRPDTRQYNRGRLGRSRNAKTARNFNNISYLPTYRPTRQVLGSRVRD